MMDHEDKLKTLKTLVKIDGEKAKAALLKEGEKIASVLKKEGAYDLLEAQIDLINIIAASISEQSLQILRDFLNRLKGLDFPYPSDLGFSEKEYQKYYNKNKMTVKVLNVIEHIRYHQPEQILDIFLEYSATGNEEIRKQALHGLQELSEYNLDIVYGNENWRGLGFAPQNMIIDKLASLNKSKQMQYFEGMITLAENLLSPTMKGTSSNYKTITWKSGAVPPEKAVKDIRNRTLACLENCYQNDLTIKQKISLISAMHSATRIHHGGSQENILKIIEENTLRVLSFFERIIPFEKLQIVEKIEDIVFWVYYHKGEKISHPALKIKNQLDKYEEYQIYKILIGFEGKFEEWTKSKRESNYQKIEDLRTKKGKEYAEEINEENYEQWENRIIEFASTESEDLATFPNFGKFLEHFCLHSPDLGLRLVSTKTKSLERFLVPIFVGLWKAKKDPIISLISELIKEGKYLYQLARIFEFNNDFDENLFEQILSEAIVRKDKIALTQVTVSIAAIYIPKNKDLINKFFIPAIKALTKFKEPSWVFGLWYRDSRIAILSDLKENDIDVILNNLLYLNKIDYHSEEILLPIAKHYPDKVINFFGKRLKTKRSEEGSSIFDAIPYDFHKLHDELSKIPEKIIPIVQSWYDGNYGMFIYKGARLLKIIFPTFPKSFQIKLIELIETNEKENIDFVLAILRNYEGQEFLHDVCKELVKELQDEELLNEVRTILQSTGVVTGEFGFSEAYEQKKKELEGWLNSADEKIRSFAESYIADLEKQIEAERKRAGEEIELRKHMYGENDN